ncbi:hypothetical protein [Streptomyces sp. ST2-7A]|uniref:hypothetical protein n=1 Tax=Streptomyces sp. ST2-7A TaxID=2907214 RepID=UPI001F3DCDD7|nr:hypothetical protein [Streptomyces sp. ST2-7A]MCE7080977.1 hypothetical protein [Streptomyces sp. ST2-7A]
MTTFPPRNLLLIRAVRKPHARHVAISGDLDYDTSEDFPETVIGEMGACPEPRELHLDRAEPGVCDSMVPSILLMLHRRVVSAGITPHPDNRQPAPNRLLGITGTFRHFIDASKGGVPAVRETGVVHPAHPRDEDRAGPEPRASGRGGVGRARPRGGRRSRPVR